LLVVVWFGGCVVDDLWLLLCLFRRDVMVYGWSYPWAGEFGVKATTRFGLGVLRSNASAKIINIKKSL
jgi:hypothetical protein